MRGVVGVVFGRRRNDVSGGADDVGIGVDDEYGRDTSLVYRRVDMNVKINTNSYLNNSRLVS